MATLTYVTGDATKPIGEGKRVIVHVCNDIGAWGAGFVLALSEEFPYSYLEKSPEWMYRKWWDKVKKDQVDEKGKDIDDVFLPLGEVQFVQTKVPDLFVANLVGQHLTTSIGDIPPIRYQAIVRGLRTIQKWCETEKAEVHCPKFGAGLAGGTWSEIEKIINSELVKKGTNVTVYEFKCPK